MAGLAAAVAATAVIIVGCTTYVPAGSMAARRSAENIAVAEALGAAGLDARSLAAAGVPAATVDELIEAVRDYLNEHPFAAVQTSHAEAASEVDRLTRVVQSGGFESLSALETARTTLASAASTRAAAVEGISTAAAAHLSQGQREALANLWANREREVPVKYRTVTRADEDWVALREALASVRIAASRQEEADPAATAVVTTADGLGATAAAAQGLGQLSAVRTAWNTAVGPI